MIDNQIVAALTDPKANLSQFCHRICETTYPKGLLHGAAVAVHEPVFSAVTVGQNFTQDGAA